MGGPTAYENYRAFAAGSDLKSIVEFTLYSDTEFKGDASSGIEPFALVNTVPAGSRRQGEPIPVAVLRAHYYLAHNLEETDWERTADDAWHAGGLAEEIASMVSLALGARLRTGGLTREFGTHGDDFGLPREHGHVPPLLPREGHRLVLPQAKEQHDLRDAVNLLSLYFQMDIPAAVALLRSARSYQAGLWLAEGDTEYAWLKLISAVEVVANHWLPDKDDPVMYLEAWDAELAQSLRDAGDTALVNHVAERLTDVTRSTYKFLKFLEEFAPEPPQSRPEEYAQIDWIRLRKALAKIYDYRSKALHAAKPFPGPLLDAPMATGGIATEHPLGLGVSHGESVWAAKDLPMHFHVFERIARCSITAWAKQSSSIVD